MNRHRVVRAHHDGQVRAQNRVIKRCGNLADAPAGTGNDLTVLVGRGIAPTQVVVSRSDDLVIGEDLTGGEKRSIDVRRGKGDVVLPVRGR